MNAAEQREVRLVKDLPKGQSNLVDRMARQAVEGRPPLKVLTLRIADFALRARCGMLDE